MSRLYWRIFLAFWLVLILTMVITVTVNTVMYRDEVAQTRLQSLFASMDALTEQAQRTLDTGGEENLRAWLERKQADLDMTIMIIDPFGQELLGRRPPPFFRKPLAADTQQRRLFRQGPGAAGNDTVHRRIRRPRPQILTGPRGEYRLFAPELFPDKPPGRWLMNREARRIFPLILVFLSGLACFLLARYLTRPIRVFRKVGNRIASGDLGARVGPEVTRRTDEFGALARDFDQMAEQVQMLLQSKQRLLRDVSHELRSPLARLQAAVGLIRQQAGEHSNPNLERIEQEAETLNKMIGQILTFSRLETVESISRQTVDVSELVSSVVENARYEGQSIRRDITLETPEQLEAELDWGLIQSAVENVVRNAMEHSAQLTTVTVEKKSNSVCITVTDDGPGVSPIDLHRLFQPFFTSDSAHSRKNKGIGVGLAIAQRAVELHGGRISAYNRDEAGGDTGLKVVITIPN